MNNQNIKEILDNLRDYCKTAIDNKIILCNRKEMIQLLDYIANLQEENEFLKLNNPEMNIEHFRIVKENKRKIDNLRKENERLKRLAEKDYTELNIAEMNATIYKSRNEKAIEKLGSIRIFGLRFGKTLFSTLINETIDILNGGDEE